MQMFKLKSNNFFKKAKKIAYLPFHNLKNLFYNKFFLINLIMKNKKTKKNQTSNFKLPFPH